LWVLALAVARAGATGRTWTGTDGVGLQDQMQYLAWIRDSARHVLASNLYDVVPSPHDYLQPLIAISALLAAAGMPPWLALLLWKPVAVAAVFFAIRGYVRRLLFGARLQLVALVIAIFFVGPGQIVARVLDRLGGPSFPWHDVTLDPWIGWWTWGYPFGLIALAAVLGSLVVYARERDVRAVPAAAALGALASWLHPWQGATLIVLLVGAEGGEWLRTGRRPRARRLLSTCLVTALPLAYYGVLGHVDASWNHSEAASSGSWPLWALAVCELPLLVPAAFAYLVRPRTFLAWTARLWPPAALLVYAVSNAEGGFALHAFLGVNVPLAVLAVEGWARVAARDARRRAPAVAAVAVALVVVPALADQLRWAEATVVTSAEPAPPNGHGDAKFVTASERRALAFLARRRPGGSVLTRSYLGTAVPGTTGRATYVGDSYWSPQFVRRAAAADALFLHPIPAGAARRFVRSVAAKFVLVDCSSRPRLETLLAPMISVVHTFGCAQVFEVKQHS
jgi:hypothetical protein